LKKYDDTIESFTLFWPKLDIEQYNFEYSHVHGVTKKNIETLNSYLDKSLKGGVDMSVTNWQSLTESSKDCIKYASKAKISNPSFKDPDLEIEVTENDCRVAKNIFFQMKNDKSYPQLLKRLQVKYLLNENAAQIWIYEYFKYLIIKIKNKDTCPSRIVSCAIQTHMENTKMYRLFNNKYNLEHSILGESETGLRRKYMNTLREYEELYGDVNQDFWKNEDNFMSEKHEKVCHLNLFRFVVARTIVINEKTAFENSKPVQDVFKIKDTTINKISQLREQRKDAEKEKTLFHWRKNFDKFYSFTVEDFKESNEAAGEKPLNEPKEDVVPDKQKRKFKLDTLYENGGMLFLLNPFDSREIQRVYVNSRSGSQKNDNANLSQDDIADVVLEPSSG